MRGREEEREGGREGGRGEGGRERERVRGREGEGFGTCISSKHGNKIVNLGK